MILKKNKIFKIGLYKHIYIRKRISIANEYFCQGCNFIEDEESCNYTWRCRISSLAIKVKVKGDDTYFIYQPVS